MFLWHVYHPFFSILMCTCLLIAHCLFGHVTCCSGLFLCFIGLPPVVLLLYWVGLPLVILDLSILSKGVETGLTGTQIGPAYAQTMPCLPGACLWQTELF